MALPLKTREQCGFDAVSLGEVMLRLDPGKVVSELQDNFMPGRVVENTTLHEGSESVLAFAQRLSLRLSITRSATSLKTA